MKLLARLRNAWHRHGPARFSKLLIINVYYYLFKRGHGGGGPPGKDPFDEKFGTDTGGIREIGSLDVTNASARFAVRYEPSSEESVKALIEQLDIEYERFSFVDYGSGKGRVLLVAAGFPFRSIVGVEFSPELQEIACRNIALLPRSVNAADRVRCVCGDATEFAPPEGDLVCYFYNPFDAPVLRPVVERLVAHHRHHRSRIIVIYVDPRHRAIFDATGEFEVVGGDASTLIFSTPALSDRTTAAQFVA